MIINPIKLFGNFFNDPNISNYRMLLFGEATLAALREALPEIASALNLPVESYRDLLGGVVTARAVLKGRTVSVDDYTDAYLDTIRQTEDTLGSKKIRKGHPVYLEFFPQGLDGYNDINRGNAHALMQLSAVAAAQHADLLGADLSDELIAFPQGWLRVRGQQQGQSGSADDKAAALRAARRVLEVALCKTLHEVGARYPADAGAAGAFFSFDLLYAPGRKKKEPEAAEG
ncbi:hypothetical protein [Flaviaesturariibacter aridisoli]|uniref:Uncharacterized protein n=1 Tax=Flaviaesturariibacter aridisoli TaxID=2545761 RepID=A0A4R4DYB0_9BACT|nr:hypothetical protein [Flaviaesturariibacter aridisoli]TCZ68256.1 hypothetical protein E0486_14370 [Flaviaesturariibacter aridisoli]